MCVFMSWWLDGKFCCGMLCGSGLAPRSAGVRPGGTPVSFVNMGKDVWGLSLLNERGTERAWLLSSDPRAAVLA